MSSEDEHSTPEPLEQIVRKVILGRGYALVSITLLFYDHLVTLNREMVLVWRKPTPTTVILLFLRYYTLVSYVVMGVALFDLNWTDSMCDRYLPYAKVYHILATGSSTLLLAMRIHALYNNRYVSGFLGIYWAAIFGLCVWAWTSGHRYNAVTPSLVPVGCMSRVQAKFPTNSLAYSWLSRCSFDFVVIFMTLWRTWRIRKRNMNGPLVNVIIRDGTLYFVAIFISELASIAFFTFAVTVNHIISNTIIVTMLSRLVFNLREEMYKAERIEQEMNATELTGLGDAHEVETGTFARMPASTTLKSSGYHLDTIDSFAHKSNLTTPDIEAGTGPGTGETSRTLAEPIPEEGKEM